MNRAAWWALLMVVLGGLLLTAGLWRRPVPAPPAAQKMTHHPTPEPSISVPPPVELQKAGGIPAMGPRAFTIGTVAGQILGTAGTLRRFRIAVESNVAGETAEFTERVTETLADPRSWTGGGQTRFQLVADGQPYDFTVYLVTRQTAYEMCRVNGVDIRENGVPYTSCRQVRQVIINLDRWRLSVPEYVELGIPLRQYREYVINHEVGHELGRGHEGCPAPGQPAPVMLTQTLSLQGCTANPWPYLDGRRYSGAPAR